MKTKQMKKVILLTIALVLGTVASNATTPEKMTINEKLRVEISKLLTNSYFLGDETIVSAKVDFLLNQNGEIVVLTVDSNNHRIVAFIKDRLNYKAIVNPGTEFNNKKYSIPVKVVSK